MWPPGRESNPESHMNIEPLKHDVCQLATSLTLNEMQRRPVSRNYMANEYIIHTPESHSLQE
jgi:hypothetical protein